MRSNPTRLGELERAVMEQLWAAQDAATTPVSVREVHEALAESRDLAYTTVMTVLDRLTKKGFVERERDGRAWRYIPSQTREQLTAETLHHTLSALSGADRTSALLHFLDESSPAELDDLRSALAALEARNKRLA